MSMMGGAHRKNATLATTPLHHPPTPSGSYRSRQYLQWGRPFYHENPKIPRIMVQTIMRFDAGRRNPSLRPPKGGNRTGPPLF